MRQPFRSASARRSPPPWRGTASGISTRQSSGSAPRRLRLRTRPSSNGPGYLTATTSPRPSVAWWPFSSAAQRPGDHQVLNLVGAFADLEHLRIAVEAGDRGLEHVAEAAVDLDRLRYMLETRSEKDKSETPS